MKRRRITVMILSVLLAVSMTGCGQDNSSSSKTAETTAATTEAVSEPVNETTDASTEAIQTTTAKAEQTTTTQAETTEVPTEASDALSEAQMKETSKKLIQEYVPLYDGVCCGSVSVDESDSYNPDPERQYFRVTDSKCQSIADIKAIVENTLSGPEYDKMIQIMFEDTVPIYLEQDGKIYVLSVGRGSAYSDSWLWDELQFTNVTANSFTVTGKYIHIADTVITQSFDIVMTENGFRISNVSASQAS
ncbi:MAG: hypothetical protein IKO47_06215 [Ruminococcus sp.]|nr:hypothetical protein [Ruminococcus sp.]